jgi:uncharacterized protein (DUF1810 family)
MVLDLGRFVSAQNGLYDQALAELRAGRKQSHWMWFVFPQLAGLGRSEKARFYGISGGAEARAHPLLGARLRSCAEALLGHAGTRAEAILGPVDAIKLRSSMTLFEAVAGDPAPFAAVLDAFYASERDAATLSMLDG